MSDSVILFCVLEYYQLSHGYVYVGGGEEIMVSKLGHTLFPGVKKELMICYVVPAHITGVQNKAWVFQTLPGVQRLARALKGRKMRRCKMGFEKGWGYLQKKCVWELSSRKVTQACAP